jgi:mannose-1-phosphate guanylyltransferase
MLPEGNILVQPCNRDTGPGLLFALEHLTQRDPDATVAVFPSDHYVGDDETFIARVSDAARLVTQWPQKVAVLGIHPDRPESGFGYITVGRPFAEGSALQAAFHVGAFQEKPSAESAGQLVREGALWNCFVMVFRVRRMIELLARVVPGECEQMRALRAPGGGMPAAYARLLPWSFSSRLLTRIAEHLVVLRVDGVHWSDWGTAEAVHRTMAALNQSPPWELLTASHPLT